MSSGTLSIALMVMLMVSMEKRWSVEMMITVLIAWMVIRVTPRVSKG